MPEQRVLLSDISWETFERLIEEREHSPGTRLSFGDGELEILAVGLGHEVANRTLAALAEITGVETNRDFEATGGTTFLRRDLRKAFEPDSSFYLRHAATVRGMWDLDLQVDPPPELVIEVDLTHSFLDRFRIWAAIGVAEVWRYDGERVRFHTLEANAYHEIEESLSLPPMTAEQATVFLELERRETAIVWDRAVREWIRSARR